MVYTMGIKEATKKHKKMLEETSKCDVVFGTCAMASEALDIHTLNTLILLTPMTDVEQASGRILRKYHEKVNPLIIDLIDKCGNFLKHGKLREDYFKGEGYVIETYSTSLNAGLTKNNWTKLVSYLESNNQNQEGKKKDPVQNTLDEVFDLPPAPPKVCLINEDDTDTESKNKDIIEPIIVAIKSQNAETCVKKKIVTPIKYHINTC